MLLKEFLEIFSSFVPVLFKDNFDTLYTIENYICLSRDGKDYQYIPLDLLNMKISSVYVSGSNISIYLK